MSEHNVIFPSATGITGLISRGLGFHPMIAACIKYALVVGAIIGAVKYWESLVADNAVKDTVIESQQGVIDVQVNAAENQTEDAESKDAYVKDATARETTTQELLLQSQARDLARLEDDYETLKNTANTRTDLREPWPDSLQRRGGFDLNRSAAEPRDKARADRGGDTDKTRVHGAEGSHPGG